VADEHADHVVGGGEKPLESRGIRCRRPTQQQAAKRQPRDVGIYVERVALEREPVSRDPEPFELEAGGKLERARLELA